MDKDIKMEFLECDTCREKSGSPTLCRGCLNNRITIEILSKKADVIMDKNQETEDMKEFLKEKRGSEYKYISHDSSSDILFCSKKKASKVIYYKMDIVTDCDNDIFFLNDTILKMEGAFDVNVFNEIISFLERQYKCVCDLKAYRGEHSLSCDWDHNDSVVKELKHEYKDFIKQ